MKRTSFVVLILTASLFAATVKSVYHTHKLSSHVVGVSCDNGADPTVLGNPTGGVLIVSCGKD